MEGATQAGEREQHYFTRRQIEKAWQAPPESDELPRYGGHMTQFCGPGDGMAERLSHLVLGVSDLDRSEAWYRDFFAMDVLGRGLTAEERPHTVLRMNTGQLLILIEQERVLPERLGTNPRANSHRAGPPSVSVHLRPSRPGADLRPRPLLCGA